MSHTTRIPNALEPHDSDAQSKGRTSETAEVQRAPPLEHVSEGTGTSIMGMQKPAAVALKMEPHHWQHLLLSQSSCSRSNSALACSLANRVLPTK